MKTRPRQLDARLVDQRGLSQEKMLKDLVTKVFVGGIEEDTEVIILNGRGKLK